VTAGDLAVVVAAGLCALGFAALVVVLWRVLQAVRELRDELTWLREDTQPLLDELQASVEDARDDLDRFDRLLGSAESISSHVNSASRVTRMALSAPVIKTVALASGTSRAASRLRRKVKP
jgi:ABC-type transporter Mla subunit MlaD